MLETLTDYIYTVFDQYADHFSDLPILNVIKKHIEQNHYNIDINDENKEEALAELAELRHEWVRLQNEEIA